MEFIAKYNVIGLAIWLVIWAQVTALAWSLIDDLVTPLILSPVFKRLGITNLEQLSWNGVLWGKVLSNVIKFIVIAFIVFLAVKNLNLPQPK